MIKKITLTVDPALVKKKKNVNVFDTRLLSFASSALFPLREFSSRVGIGNFSLRLIKC